MALYAEIAMRKYYLFQPKHFRFGEIGLIFDQDNVNTIKFFLLEIIGEV